MTPGEQIARFTARYGTPVLFDPYTKQVAHAAGLWPRKRIVAGPQWLRLPEREREGVLLHEFAHCRGMHKEIRLLLVGVIWVPLVYVLPWPVLVACAVTAALCGIGQAISYRQEYAADRFAVDRGYGVEFAQFVGRGGSQEDDLFHPPHAKRLERIALRLKEQSHEVAA